MYRSYTNSTLNKHVRVTTDTNNPYVEVKANQSSNISVDVYKEKGVDKFFLFRQNIPSQIWSIQHGLDKFPSVTVVDSGDNVVIGEVQYIDYNNLIIQFTSAFSGKAYLN